MSRDLGLKEAREAVERMRRQAKKTGMGNLSPAEVNRIVGEVRRDMRTRAGVSRMFALAAVGVLGIAAGCPSAPELQAPSVTDVLKFDDQIRAQGQKAKVVQAWAGKQNADTAVETSNMRHTLRRIAAKAGLHVPEIGAVDSEGRILR